MPATGGAATTLNDCCALLPSVLPWPVMIMVALPLKLFGSEICKTPFCVSVMMLAESIVTGVLARLMPPEDVVGTFNTSL